MKDRWDKFKIISSFFTAITTIFVVGYFAHVYTVKKNVQSEYVKLAVDILRHHPSPSDNKDIREWAIEIIDRYSDVKLKKETKTRLINTASFLPKKIAVNECEEYLRRAQELLKAGEREGANDYFNKLKDDCDIEIDQYKEN